MRRQLMDIDIRSDHSGYIMIGDYTIYIEVSEATENKPKIAYWKDDWDDDRTVTITGSSSTR